jgi:hypothetical protein
VTARFSGEIPRRAERFAVSCYGFPANFAPEML